MESNLNFEEKPYRVGVFPTVEKADEAVDQLLAAGFTDKQISVVCSDKTKEAHFKRFEHEQPAGSHTTAAAASGAAVGGLLGMLSMATVAATSGGLGLLVFGPLFIGTAGAGALVGGLVGAMTTRGMEDELANFYDQAVVSGKTLVAAEAHGANAAARLSEAETILKRAGSEPVSLSRG
jgi:hypothetical protein